MDEHISNLEECASSNDLTPSEPAASRGRRPKFTAEEDLILVREVAAAHAHVAPYGDIRTRFAAAAHCANSNADFKCKVNAKSLQDRYLKLQSSFDRRDSEEHGMSGVGGAVGEMDELPGMMAEVRQDCEERKLAATKAARARTEVKERLGKELVRRSLKRRASSSKSSDEIEDKIEDHDGEKKDEEDGRKKRKACRNTDGIDTDADEFATSLCKVDMERIGVERARLNLERERLENEKKERALDREERRAERELEYAERRKDREAATKLDLEKFKLLLEMMERNK